MRCWDESFKKERSMGVADRRQEGKFGEIIGDLVVVATGGGFLVARIAECI